MIVNKSKIYIMKEHLPKNEVFDSKWAIVEACRSLTLVKIEKGLD